MRILCLSDCHGHTPEIPDCDLLLIAGDCPPATNHSIDFQVRWYSTIFKEWLQNISDRGIKIIGVEGNHSFAFQDKSAKKAINSVLPWTYLEDSGTEFNGLKIWGSPWTPYFGGWAFNLQEKDLKKKWKLIPEDTNILITHGQPQGIHDSTEFGDFDLGSWSLRQRIRELKNLKLYVGGHLHHKAGQSVIDDIIFVNAAYLDDRYRPHNKSLEMIEI